MEQTSSFWSIGSFVVQAAKNYYWSPAPANNNSFEEKTEEFGLLVSLAAAKRLPEGSKPSRSNHRITWDQPIRCQPTDSTTINSQGAKRRACNWLGIKEARHDQIIPKWPNDIETAIILHFPNNLLE